MEFKVFIVIVEDEDAMRNVIEIPSYVCGLYWHRLISDKLNDSSFPVVLISYLASLMNYRKRLLRRPSESGSST